MKFKMIGKLVILMLIAIGEADITSVFATRIREASRSFKKIQPQTLGSVSCSCNNTLNLNIFYIDSIICKECPGYVCHICPEGNPELRDKENGEERSGREPRESEDKSWPPEDHWCPLNQKADGILNCTIKSYRKKCDLICREDKKYTFECIRKELVWEPAFKSCAELEGYQGQEYENEEYEDEGYQGQEHQGQEHQGQEHQGQGAYRFFKKRHILEVPSDKQIQSESSEETGLTEGEKPADDTKSIVDLARFIQKFAQNIGKSIFPETDKEGTTSAKPLQEEIEISPNLTHGTESSNNLNLKEIVESSSEIFSTFQTERNVSLENKTEGTTSEKATHEELEISQNLTHGTESSYDLNFKEIYMSSFGTFKTFQTENNMPVENKTERANPVKPISVDSSFRAPNGSKRTHQAMITDGLKNIKNFILTSMASQAKNGSMQNKVQATPVKTISLEFKVKDNKMYVKITGANFSHATGFHPIKESSTLNSMPPETKRLSSENKGQTTPAALMTEEFELKTSKTAEKIHEAKSKHVSGSDESLERSTLSSIPPLRTHMNQEFVKVQPTPIRSMSEVSELKTVLSHNEPIYYKGFNKSSFTTSVPSVTEHTHAMTNASELTNDNNELNDTDDVITDYGDEDKLSDQTENLGDNDIQYRMSTSELPVLKNVNESSADNLDHVAVLILSVVTVGIGLILCFGKYVNT